MKAVVTLLALVGSTLAANAPRHGKEEHPDKGYPVVTYGQPSYVATTKTIDTTYTTVCPVTETITYPGKTITTTYTTTKVVYTKILTTYYETVKGPDVVSCFVPARLP